MMTMTLTLTPQEAAEELRLSRMSVHRLIRSGELVSFKVGRSRRIARNDLERFVEEHLAETRLDAA